MPGPSAGLSTQITWLKTSADALQSEITSMIDDVRDPETRQVLTRITELVKLQSELQALGYVSMLSYMRENQEALDQELMEISEYMSTIINIHRKEAETLEKVL
ncbi:MAG: hypothetical protein NWE89_04705 [Candidatus Bathyarchaeota archaeon]|nr:hypothetical protein [Candidatus Bathyarchaeota archaeon]